MTGRGLVTAVRLKAAHGIGKHNQLSIRLVAGLGVDGDVHAGTTVRHRSRLNQTPLPPNLRQVHLIHAELFDELAMQGFAIKPGMMGENITTRDLNLLRLPQGTRLRLGQEAVVEVTGLRNPCNQLDGIAPGLMSATLARDEQGGLVRRAGIMSVVLNGGDVRQGDSISVELPASPHRPLEPV